MSTLIPIEVKVLYDNVKDSLFCCRRTFSKYLKDELHYTFYKAGNVSMVDYNPDDFKKWVDGRKIVADDLILARDAPKLYNISYMTIYRAYHSGEIKGVVKGMKGYLYVSKRQVEKLCGKHSRYHTFKGVQDDTGSIL